PLPENGTVKVVLTAPVLELVPPEVIVAAGVPKVTVSALLGLKFVPVIVTLEPTVPETGLGSPSETTWLRSAIASFSRTVLELRPVVLIASVTCSLGSVPAASQTSENGVGVVIESMKAIPAPEHVDEPASRVNTPELTHHR